MHRIVQLNQDIPNPNVDRRAKRDWTKAEFIKAGRYHDNGSSIRQVAGTGYGWLSGRDREFFLTHAVEVSPRSAEETLYVMEMEHLAADVLNALLEQGKISHADIRATEDPINARYA